MRRFGRRRNRIAIFQICAALASVHSKAALDVPSLNEAIASKEDLWADTALLQPDGPNLEFFRSLIPPLHYVNTDFSHYPIVLSAPGSPVKARLVANGSGINLRANTRAWNETGTAVLFRVGNDELAYGEFLDRLEGPKWFQGYLPIVQNRYHHAGGTYEQETFASVDPQFASNAVCFTRFSFEPADPAAKENGRVAIRFDTSESLKSDAGRILNEQGKVILWFDGAWKWQAGRKVLVATFTNSFPASVAVASLPMSADTPSPFAGADGGFASQWARCLNAWQKILANGMNIQVPEPYVNNTWRALVLANFSLISGDKIFYSAGNQYEKLYEQEGSSAALALLDYGYEEEYRRLLLPLLDFTRKGLEYHQAGFKLDDVRRFYWQTRDVDFVRSIRSRWEKSAELLGFHRPVENGLYPREQYCGDIPTPVFSLNSNAKGWRALRDTSALLDALGDKQEADRLRKVAADFRKDILSAVAKSTSGTAGFIPNALLGEEQAYDVITATKMGGYWNLMANNILGSGIFGKSSPQEDGLMRYFQHHGGLCIGLARTKPWPGFWVSTANLNPLYGWPYVHALLERDEPDRALVSFYGMLAAGMTPDTFICGEGCALEPVDKWGRQFYCPPNSAGNAFWLEMLRNLLVQELNDDEGKPQTLRLLFATPKRWLADGQSIRLERAPTAFGPVSLTVQSKLAEGWVLADVDLPTRNPAKETLLRIRVPDGWRVVSAETDGKEFKVDERGTVDLSAQHGKIAIQFKVTHD